MAQAKVQPVDLSRVPIRYAFELYSGGKLLRTVTLPAGPSRVQIEPVHAGSVGYTFGDQPDRQHTPRRRWNIVANGRTGLAPREGYNRTGKLVTLSGGQTVLEFDAFLAGYQAEAAAEGATYLSDPDKYRQLRDNVYLIFRAYDEGLHLKVEVPTGGWRFLRAIESSRLGSYEWTLQLQGYAEVGRKATPSPLGSPQAAKADARSFAQRASAGIDVIANGVATATGAVGVVESAIQRIAAPVGRLQRIGVDLRRFVGAAASLASIPRRLLLDLAITAEQVLAAFTDAQSMGLSVWDGTGDAAERLQNACIEAETLARESTTTYGRLRGSPQTYATMAGALTLGSAVQTGADAASDVETNVLAYSMQAGETLQDVAEKTLGNPAAWITIAAYNGFADAYTTPEGAPLQAGDVVLVPGGSLGGAGVPSLLAGDLYGTDLALDMDTGDLLLSEASGVYQDAAGAYSALAETADDLRTVSGAENLKQAVLLRMLTPRGSVRSLRDYGLLSSPGSTISAAQVAQVAADVREQMLQDPRIADVVDIAVIDDGDGLGIDMTIVPVASAAIGLVAPVDSGLLATP